MRIRSVLAIAAVSVLTAGTSRADFKYTQQSKMTGGALAGVTKTLGVFSKSARQANEAQISTTMIRGNRLRTEHATGDVEIIDLDERRFIHIDNAKKTYTIQTFDQLKQQIADAQEKAKAEQTKAVAKKDDPQKVTMVPKFDMQATGQTRPVMNIPAKEVKMRVDMLFQSTDPKTQADLEKSNASYWMTSDAWYGTIPGYDEVRQFYMKMAKELNWLPGSMGMANPQMTQAADEFRKNAVKMDGMPLVQFTSFGMASNGQAGQGTGAPDTQQQPPPSTTDNSTPTNPKEAIAKSIGGLFGKKKQQQQQQQNDSNANAPTSSVPPPPPVPGSLMDMTIEVTSYSKDSLDASLFNIPDGYTQIQPQVPKDSSTK
jgi:hypothetical protein